MPQATHMLERNKIGVLIVDDSASARAALASVLSSDPDFEIIGTAADPYAAAEKIKKRLPDVVFLDIDMPRMDGLTFLRKIMAQRPLPVVICSGLAEQGSDVLLAALEAGAVDVITKPRVDTAQFFADSSMVICDIARAAAWSKKPAGSPLRTRPVIQTKLLADEIIPPLTANRLARLRATMPQTDPVFCIGASTGGTEALAKLLSGLPATAPATLVVQHMPENFTAAFARRLDGLCAVQVKEAQDGDLVTQGQVLIAPGNRHMMLQRSGSRYTVQIASGPYICRHRPSVDVLFRSAAQAAGANVSAAILTGMGDDGARGLGELREAGAYTIAQDEATCVVFGMPHEAIERGAAMAVEPLDKIAKCLLKSVHQRQRQRP